MAPELRYRAEWGGYAGLPKNLDEYLSLFDGAAPGQRTGEASAWYLWSQSAAAAIAELRPDARIVAILREPASFLRSLHMQCVQAHIEPEKDLRRAIAAETKRRHKPGPAPRDPSDWPRVLPAVGGLIYSDYVRYTDQLRRYLDQFPTENVLTLIYDDYLEDNDGTVRKVLRFVGADENTAAAATAANPTVRVRSRRLNDLLRNVYMGEGTAARRVKGTLKRVVPSQRLRRRAVETMQHQVLYTAPPPPDAALMAELRGRFKPEVEALGKHLQRDLVALWNY
jgi:hypothetical protein